MKRTIIILSLLIGCATVVQAQFSQFHVGGVFPSGKFGDGNENKENLGENGHGFAAIGFTVGYKHYSRIGERENLAWVFGIEGFCNGVNSDYKDDTEKYWKDVTFPLYLNFPATVGLNYSIPVDKAVTLYGEAAIGANLSMLTNFSCENSRSNSMDREYRFTPAAGFTYALEGGMFLHNKYSIGLRYNNLGSYKYKYEIHYKNGDKDKSKRDKASPITVISVCAGILF